MSELMSTECDTPLLAELKPAPRRALCIGFIGLLLLPLVFTGTPWGDPNNPVWEAKKSLPPLKSSRDVLRYPVAFVRYFNSHFGFRGHLMRFFALLRKSDLLLADGEVLFGKDGWLYYVGTGIVDELRGGRPFSQADLDSWAKLLVRRRDWLEARGVPYVFFFAPNTASIYPEYLPDYVVPTKKKRRLEQLTEYLRTHTDLDFLDLTPSLLDAKARDAIYYRTDSHWNLLGGLVAYEKLSDWMKARFPEWRVFGAEEFDRVQVKGWHGHLCYMVGDPDHTAETRLELLPKSPTRVLTDGIPLPNDETYDAWTVRPLVVRDSADGEIDRAVIFRDSQMSAPAQFLSRHFRRTVMVWTNVFDPEVIDKERPRVVIQEMVERSLNSPVPVDPPLWP